MTGYEQFILEIEELNGDVCIGVFDASPFFT